MNTIDDETGREAILRKLLPNVVGMPLQKLVGAVAEMRRHSRSGGYGVGDLFCAINQLGDSEVDALVSEYRERYTVAPPLRKAELRLVYGQGFVEATEMPPNQPAT